MEIEMNSTNTKVENYNGYNMYTHEFDMGNTKALLMLTLHESIPVNKIEFAITSGTALDRMD